MASTNKTTHYELSQYIGSDKPTYLGDYNGDMSKIDAQMYQNATNASLALTNAGTAQDTADSANTLATTANGTANQNATNIGTLSDLTTGSKTNLVSAINEVKSNVTNTNNNIGTLSNLNTTDQSSIVNAINEVNRDTGWVNLTLGSGWSVNDQTPQYRVIGKTVHFRANLTGSASNTTIATGIPSEYLPSETVSAYGVLSGKRMNMFVITTTGEVTIAWEINLNDASDYTGSTWHNFYASYVLD